MTTQETSRESYRILIESGKLRGNQAKALEAVVKHGPGTSGEIIDAMNTGDVVHDRAVWRARFTELAGRGLIVEVGQRTCRATGRTAMVWQYSGRTKPLEARHRASPKVLRDLLGRVVKACEVKGETFPPSPTLLADIREALR